MNWVGANILITDIEFRTGFVGRFALCRTAPLPTATVCHPANRQGRSGTLLRADVPDPVRLSFDPIGHL
jgi:hypothetical protein